MRGDPEKNIVALISKKPRTFEELEIILHIPASDLTRKMKKIRKRERVKFIKAGSRNVYFKSELQRKVADIMSLGKWALPIYNHIKKYGPKRTEELDRELGATWSSLRSSTFNLVDSGYLKCGKTDYKRGGNLYYIKISEEELKLKMIGWREEQAYRIIDASEKPITAKILAERMSTDSNLALNTADNLVSRGMVYKPKPNRANKDFNNFREAVYYTNPKQESLAMLMSISPFYGEKIYKHLRRKPRTTVEIAKYSELRRPVVAQVLELFLKHGLVEMGKDAEKQGNPRFWYLRPDSPRIYNR